MPLADTLPKLQQGQGFASLKLVDDYLATGKLPAIHDDIGTMLSRIPTERRKGAADLGACHGLIAVRAALLGFSPVLGFELDPNSVGVFNNYVSPKLDRRDVKLITHKLIVRDPSSLHNFVEPVKSWGVNTVIARRAFPELFSDTYGKEGLTEVVWRDAGLKFGQACLSAGVEFIVIEGRKWRGYKNLSNPLYRVENEIEALGPGWIVRDRFKEVALLERAA